MTNNAAKMSDRPSDERMIGKESRSMASKAMLLTLASLVSIFSFAQDTGTGKVIGGYNTNQSVEFGGHIAGVGGSQGVYKSFVNIQSGPRLLDYSLNMKALTHEGMLFDNLSFNNFGYGGDPLNLSKLIVSKKRVYDFTATFRRDVNYFDYNTLSNPFNYAPTANNLTRASLVEFDDAPHLANTRRKMGDFNLTLFPQSAFRVRLGYARNFNDGLMYSSFHEGTDVQLLNNFASREDQYRIGFDFKVAPRTTISYDQFFLHNRVNNNLTDPNVGNYFISVNGVNQPVDIGGVYSPYYAQPCGNDTAATPTVLTASSSNVLSIATCGIYRNYSRTSPSRGDMPTEQFSMRSNYWRKLDVSISGMYSSGENDVTNYNEILNAYITRTNELGYQYTGPSAAKRTAAGIDFGATYHISDKWSYINQTHWLNWRNRGEWDSNSVACFPSTATATASVTVYTTPGSPAGATSCAGIAAAGTPAHTSASPADLDAYTYRRGLAVDSVNTTNSLAWDPNRRFGAHVGYRYGTRDLASYVNDSDVATYLAGNITGVSQGTRATGIVTSADIESDSVSQTEHAFLIGLIGRPTDDWRINADFDMAYIDHPFEPIAPGHEEKFKLRSSYRANAWISISGAINLTERRNSIIPTNPDGTAAFSQLSTSATQTTTGFTSYASPRHQDHVRQYALNFSLTPTKWAAVDFGWSYDDVYSQSGACLYVSGSTTGLVPQGGQIARCQTVGEPYSLASTGDAAIPAILNYADATHNGYVNIRLTPNPRISLNIGYDIVSNSGKNDWLRADTLAVLMFPVDAAGNVVYAGNTLAGAVVGYAPGPNPYVPLGPQAMNWHRPMGSVEYGLTKTISFKGAYNYYGYNEKTASGPVAPRDFHANVGTLSLKYAF